MKTKSMGVSEFKAKCLSLVDEVAATGEGIVVTKHGRKVAMLVAVPAEEPVPSVIGWHAGQGKIVGDLIRENESDAWEHMK